MKVKCNNCTIAVINNVPCHEQGCHGTTIYIRNGRESIEFKVYGLDVWGNAKDGFEVNDRHCVGSIVIPVNSENKDIIKALKANNLLRKGCHVRSFCIDGDDHSMTINATRDGEPIYDLEAA